MITVHFMVSPDLLSVSDQVWTCVGGFGAVTPCCLLWHVVVDTPLLIFYISMSSVVFCKHYEGLVVTMRESGLTSYNANSYPLRYALQLGLGAKTLSLRLCILVVNLIDKFQASCCGFRVTPCPYSCLVRFRRYGDV